MSELDEAGGATWIVLPGTEIAEGVKVGDDGNHNHVEQPAAEEDEDEGEMFGPWGLPDLLLRAALILLAVIALGAVIGFAVPELGG